MFRQVKRNERTSERNDLGKNRQQSLEIAGARFNSFSRLHFQADMFPLFWSATEIICSVLLRRFGSRMVGSTMKLVECASVTSWSGTHWRSKLGRCGHFKTDTDTHYLWSCIAAGVLWCSCIIASSQFEYSLNNLPEWSTGWHRTIFPATMHTHAWEDETVTERHTRHNVHYIVLIEFNPAHSSRMSYFRLCGIIHPSQVVLFSPGPPHIWAST